MCPSVASEQVLTLAAWKRIGVVFARPFMPVCLGKTRYAHERFVPDTGLLPISYRFCNLMNVVQILIVVLDGLLRKIELRLAKETNCRISM